MTGAAQVPRQPQVVTVAEVGVDRLRELLAPRGLQVTLAGAGEEIPGTYWGAPEAGLIGRQLFVREDTPVHSALHEAAHFICMDAARRAVLHTDAGGTFDEESAVCYLQILLAGDLAGMGRDCMLADMDTWGYTFRLGSARRWFEEDATDAREWLDTRGLVAPGTPE